MDSTGRKRPSEPGRARSPKQSNSGSVPSANSNPTAAPECEKAKQRKPATHMPAQAARRARTQTLAEPAPPPRGSRAPGGPSPGAPTTTRSDATAGASWCTRAEPTHRGARARANPRRGARPSLPYNHLPHLRRLALLVERVVPPPRALRLRPLYPATKNYQKNLEIPKSARSISIERLTNPIARV
jgi:hypothetical protein